MKLQTEMPLDQSASNGAYWKYTEEAITKLRTPHSPIDIDTKFTEFKFDKLSQTSFFQHNHYTFYGSLKPYFPDKIKKIINKSRTRKLSEKEATSLMKGIAKLSIEFYGLEEGKFVAIGFDGRIYDVADTPLDLLSKIQGRKFRTQIFVWNVGSNVFSGWKT